VRRRWLTGIAMAFIAAAGVAVAEDSRPRSLPPPPDKEGQPPPTLAPAPAPSPGLGGADPTRGAGPAHMIAFTFDDGPNEHYTRRILAALAAHDVPATFFVIGRDLDERPRRRAMLAAIARAGHTIGNHTFDHARLTTLGPAERDAEIDRLAAIVEAETGTTPAVLRPPYGDSSPHLRAALAARGLTEVRWNIDPRDWTYRDPALARKAIVDAIVAAGSGIIILHDTEKATAFALDGVLDDLDALNCKRLAHKKAPIIPVSLHYFLRDAGVPRAVPPDVAARTDAYRTALQARCESAIDNHKVTH
jgi:peptidoglycan/xylan/chitin deacetylase (PgdA/CDA1 family)